MMWGSLPCVQLTYCWSREINFTAPNTTKICLFSWKLFTFEPFKFSQPCYWRLKSSGMLCCVDFFLRVKQSAYPLFPLELLFRMFRNFPILKAKFCDLRGTWKQNAQVISSFQIFRPNFICGSHFLYVEQRIRPSNSSGFDRFNPLNAELNPICYLLALLGAHHFLHVSRIRVKLLTFRLLMSCIYGAPILDVSRSHTTTQHSR